MPFVCSPQPDTSTLAFAWSGTPSGSPLRRLLVALIRQCWTGDRAEYYSDLWTNDLVNGIGSEEDLYPLMCNLVKLARTDERTLRVTMATWKKVKACEWHVHEEFVSISCFLSFLSFSCRLWRIC